MTASGASWISKPPTTSSTMTSTFFWNEYFETWAEALAFALAASSVQKPSIRRVDGPWSDEKWAVRYQPRLLLFNYQTG